MGDHPKWERAVYLMHWIQQTISLAIMLTNDMSMPTIYVIQHRVQFKVANIGFAHTNQQT